MPGSLKNHIQFWHSIGTSQLILVVIDEGYRIPFFSTPPPSFLRNSKSALAHPSFVDKAISELLFTYRVFETDVIPCNLIPCPFPSSPQGRSVCISDSLISTHGRRVLSLRTLGLFYII